MKQEEPWQSTGTGLRWLQIVQPTRWVNVVSELKKIYEVSLTKNIISTYTNPWMRVRGQRLLRNTDIRLKYTYTFYILIAAWKHSESRWRNWFDLEDVVRDFQWCVALSDVLSFSQKRGNKVGEQFRVSSNFSQWTICETALNLRQTQIYTCLFRGHAASSWLACILNLFVLL